ncbi:hypothetical protein DXA09_20665 [Absiella sp. AM54-8XD]|nr:hypothetical protein DXA09_20665 [Absiella sp. AM54-8XD]
MIAYGRTFCRSQLDKYFSPLLQSLYLLYELKIHINRIYKTVRLCNYTLSGCFCFLKNFFENLGSLPPLWVVRVRKGGNKQKFISIQHGKEVSK